MTKLREDDADMQVTDGAVATIRQNAEDGLVEAEFFLGDMYREGRGVQQDGVEAAKWYRKAADQGHTEAKYALGLMYYYGEVVRQDYMEAVRWYRLAAEEGHTDAKYALGVMYRMGRGVLQDYAESYKWHNLAASEVWSADNGVEELKRYEDARDAVAKLMPPPANCRGAATGEGVEDPPPWRGDWAGENLHTELWNTKACVQPKV